MISQSQAIKYHLINGLNWFTKYILRHINKYTIGTTPENMLRNPLFYKKNLCILKNPSYKKARCQAQRLGSV